MFAEIGQGDLNVRFCVENSVIRKVVQDLPARVSYADLERIKALADKEEIEYSPVYCSIPGSVEDEGLRKNSMHRSHKYSVLKTLEAEKPLRPRF